MVQVLPSTPAGTTITDTTAIHSDTSDPNPVNNSTTFTNLTATQANLSVTQTIAPGPVVAGRPRHLHDHGRRTPAPVTPRWWRLSDVVPANTTFVSDAQTSGPAFILQVPPPAAQARSPGRSPRWPRASRQASPSSSWCRKARRTERRSATRPTVTTATTDPNLANNSSTVTTGSVAATGADLSVTATMHGQHRARGLRVRLHGHGRERRPR